MTHKPSHMDARRAAWRHRGTERPSFAVNPAPAQESVWDYPRPPRLEPDARLVEVRLNDLQLARSTRAARVLETASPPTFYVPPQDVAVDRLEPLAASSVCEWKGRAKYFTTAGAGGKAVAWCYPEPFAAFAALGGWFSFYPGRVDCLVNGERVRPQPGEFYGGWVTDELVGPFKGEPGSEAW